MEVQTSSKPRRYAHRPNQTDRITPAQDTRARFLLGAGYTATRVAEIVGVPVAYCEFAKAGGFFVSYCCGHGYSVPRDVYGRSGRSAR